MLCIILLATFVVYLSPQCLGAIGLSGHNLTSLKRDDRNVARVCVHCAGGTDRRLQSWHENVSTGSNLLEWYTKPCWDLHEIIDRLLRLWVRQTNHGLIIATSPDGITRLVVVHGAKTWTDGLRWQLSGTTSHRGPSYDIGCATN